MRMKEESTPNPFVHSLGFKIGLMIILAEIAVSAVTGALYIGSFNAEIDRTIERKVLLPGSLMNAGLLNLDVVTDEESMRGLVGEELINAFVIGINGNIFFSLDSEYVGKSADSVSRLDFRLLTPRLTEPLVRRDASGGIIHAIAPLLGMDGQTVRFFVYIEVSTAKATAQKLSVIWLFVTGSLGVVLLTSIIILFSFQLTVFAPLHLMLRAVAQVETGDLDARIAKSETRDELGDLARAFNRMAARLRQNLEKLRREEEKIRRLNQDLELRVADRTSRLEAANRELESFSYSVSHDLRAPLRHIDGYVELLISRCREDLTEKGRHYLDIVADSARQMGQLIDDLLRFSRTGREEMRLECVDMNKTLNEALSQIQDGCAGRRIDWTIGELPVVRGDYSLLRQIWVNLLGNAVKYTSTREVAKIDVDAVEGAAEHTFVVADNGVGFEMAYAGKLFGVFQRMHAEGEFEGSGIGLAIVKRIIDRHGGRVWAEAEPDRGARFYFTLPKYKEDGDA
ncbi:MAG TPA: hypothetical protein DIC34_08035 [Treponema sp.]|nr:MAG: hypothetical protein A2Y36_08130 [Treponema sp. GWA1_62_8]OHE62911.1 MAG: hypothetical protein A2001_00475 [Treponema sp. GWC1_61_84]HCM26474.1 hypothetical protein [Treponema sp.]